MKRLLMIVVCLCLFASAALAQTPLVVGSTTAMSGNFFSDVFGNNTADNDVRVLLHDYCTVAFGENGSFDINETAVREVLTELSPSGNKTYTFYLQKDLRYCDGSAITAQDYVFSSLLLGSQMLAEIGGSNTKMNHIQGYAPYITGLNNVFSGVRLLDEYAFSLTILSSELPNFYELALVAVTPYPISVIAPGCSIRDDGQGAYIMGDMTGDMLRKTLLDEQTGYLSHPTVTSGPYMLVAYDKAAKRAEFAVNPYYKGNSMGQKSNIEHLVFCEVQNDTLLAKLQSGEVDLVNKVTSGSVIHQGLNMVVEEQLAAVNYLRAGFSFIAFACEQSVPSDEAVRKAVAMCIDGKALCDEFLMGFGVPIYGYYGYGQWMVAHTQEQLKALNRYQPDLAAAARLLESGGWTYDAQGAPYSGTGARYRVKNGALEELVLRYAKTRNNTAADIVERMLSESFEKVGIRLETTAVSTTEMFRRYYRQDERVYDMFFLASNFSYVFDPYFTYSVSPALQGVLNTSGLTDSTLMELARSMRETEPGDEQAYIEKWLDFQAYWVDVLPMVPLYTNLYYDFFNTRLKDYYANAYQSWAVAIVYADVGELEP